MPVTALILALILALAAPSLAFSSLLLLRSDNISRNALAARADDGVRSIAETLDREIRGMVTNLSVFAASGWIETEAYDLLHARAREALAGSDIYLVVADENLDQILNTRLPWDASTGPLSNPAPPREAMESGRPVLSDVFDGRIAQEPVFNVSLPIISGEVRARVLLLSRGVKELDNVFQDSLPPPGWAYAVLDRSGRLAAGAGPVVGPSDLLASLCTGETSGLVQMRAGGVNYSAAAKLLPTWGWRACVWTSSDQVEADISQRWRNFTLLVLVIVAITILGGAALGRMLGVAISRAATVGRALDAGRDVPAQRSIVREVDDVLATLTRAARSRLQHEKELRVLLRETAHRAKNQIAITAALVRLSARSAITTDQLRDDITARLAALGRSIDMMSANTSGAVSLSELVAKQLEPFANAPSDRLSLTGADLRVPPAIAQALGLVLHEKATNASKYGAWSTTDGRVSVTWAKADNVLEVVWHEHGGPPASEPTRSGFGSSLVEMMIEKTLGGTVERDFRKTGLLCVMRVPLPAMDKDDA